MKRSFEVLSAVAILALVAMAFTATRAGAQTTAAAESVACPHGRLSIYYASGESTATPQAQLLIGRIGETATSCEPDGIDLVARIDVRADGDRAVAVALERLSRIAGDLIAQGLPAERIRIAAQATSSTSAPGLNQVDVLFRKASKIPGEAVNPLPPVPSAHTFASPAI